jgi:hypothetical protein
MFLLIAVLLLSKENIPCGVQSQDYILGAILRHEGALTTYLCLVPDLATHQPYWTTSQQNLFAIHKVLNIFVDHKKSKTHETSHLSWTPLSRTYPRPTGGSIRCWNVLIHPPPMITDGRQERLQLRSFAFICSSSVGTKHAFTLIILRHCKALHRVVETWKK